MMNLLRKNIISKVLGAHRAKVFDTSAAAELSKNLLTSNSFMVSISTFIRLKHTPPMPIKIE